MIADFEVSDNCWNSNASYGMICVRCGCCSKDKAIRYKARIKYLEAWVDECENFNGWAKNESLRKMQEENMKSNIKYYRQRLYYYKKKLKEVE